MSTTRLEAFSDGVIAVAITLLALNLTFPAPGTKPLGAFLAHQWPAYVAYVISFATIGIIWINHHAAIGRLREADHSILVINLLLLMSICVLPFTTHLMASYLTASGGERLAAVVYSGSLLVMGVCFSLLNAHTLLGRSDLLSDELTAEQRRGLLLRANSGIAPYALAVLLSLLSPYLGLAICGAVAMFYALPVANTIR
jgi:TMEM175 potassium channel family protein